MELRKYGLGNFVHENRLELNKRTLHTIEMAASLGADPDQTSIIVSNHCNLHNVEKAMKFTLF